MSSYNSEETISLWEDDGRKNVTLRNLQTGKRFEFVVKRSFVVGRVRGACDLQISTDDRYMSGKHLWFLNEGGRIYIEDLHSKNGTKLNDRPVIVKTRVQSGDVLQMGRSKFEVIL